MHAENFWKKLNKPVLALAPMAGFTDSAFRTICKEYGADVVYSEMASVSALFHGPIKSPQGGVAKSEFNGVNPSKTLELLRFTKKERPYVVQLFGSNPEHFAFAAKLLSSLPLSEMNLRKNLKNNSSFKSPLIPLFQRGRLLRPDGIDINFGCPAPKVFKTGAGCALMRDKKLARKIISAVCENTNLPVSIKIRAGIGKSSAIDFIKYIKDLPFSAAMVHGRTYAEGFSGPVDFKIIEKIKNLIPDKIVLANGGINSPIEAVEILQKYPTLDGLGIARGALGRPFIFEEIKKAEPRTAKSRTMKQGGIASGSKKLDSSTTLGTTKSYDFSRIKKIILQHAKLVWQKKKETGILELRKHLGWYVKGFPGASKLRQELVQVRNLKEIKSILDKI